MRATVSFRRDPPLDSAVLNSLFAAAWPGHVERDFAPVEPAGRRSGPP
jgi:hypothetical protein